MSWDDLHAFIFAAPPGSAVFHAVERGWTTTDHLLASVVDLLAILAWQNTEDAQKGRNRPRPVPRPADELAAQSAQGGLLDGSPATPMTVGEFLARREAREKAWLARNQPPAQEGGDADGGHVLADDPPRD